jgi:hypothetical protein
MRSLASTSRVAITQLRIRLEYHVVINTATKSTKESMKPAQPLLTDGQEVDMGILILRCGMFRGSLR